ncbi:MAG: DUF559 domain-containing protein [Pseudoxanthomonas sp.]
MRNGQKRDRARELRRGMTLAERRLWNILRLRRLDGFRFRRQCPIGPYIADFACVEARLVAEVDGGQHMDCTTDGSRDAFLRRKGFHVLRFWNNELMANLEGVRALIAQRLAEACPPPSLPPQAEEGADQGD